MSCVEQNIWHFRRRLLRLKRELAVVQYIADPAATGEKHITDIQYTTHYVIKPTALLILITNTIIILVIIMIMENLKICGLLACNF